MSELRITSVRKPFDDPDVAREAFRTLAWADAMGLIGESENLAILDLPTMRRVTSAISAAGIATGLTGELGAAEATGHRRLAAILRGVNAALDASPAPEHEWSSLTEIFGLPELGEVVGISPASARRYQTGERTTPDHVAVRLHFLALLVADLAGAYNEIGIRRWFRRKRAALGGRSPADVLAPGWDVDGDEARQVRDLAQSLVASPAT